MATANSITIMATAKRKKKKTRYPACLVHAVIRMFYSVVANQRQPQYTCNILQRWCQPRSTIIRIFLRGAGGGGGGVLICCLPWAFDHSLTTHSFRDGAPFISTPNSLIDTPPTFRRSLRFFHVLHGNCLFILSPSCFAVRGYHIFLRIAIVFSLLSSLPKTSTSHTFDSLISSSNASPSSLYISHSPTVCPTL